MDRFIRDHPDLEQAIADWARVHPHGTEADAITDLSLWPRPDDQDAQWLVWRELRKYDQSGHSPCGHCPGQETRASPRSA
jgi:hypothetical protein